MISQTMILEDGSELILIHFLFPMQRGLLEADGEPLVAQDQTHRVACCPGLVELSAQPQGRSFPWHRSEDPRAVNCPLCKQTEEWQAAMAVYGGEKPERPKQMHPQSAAQPMRRT